jgi:hypothetical protein
VAHPQIAIFARLANGNTAPVRKIEGQKTLLGRTMHAIAYDEIHDEFVVPQAFAQAVLTFRGGANGEEAPVRVIQGSRTQLGYPDQLAIDAVHNEIFVPQRGRILVFERGASGNVAPIRVLESGNGIRLGNSLAVDPVNNLLVVSGSVAGGDGEGGSRRSQARMLIYNRTDAGPATPKAMIGGPASRYSGGSLTVYPSKGLIIAVSYSNPQPYGGKNETVVESTDGYVGVWSITDRGDTPPRWIIGGPNGVFRRLHNVAVDAKNKSLIVSDQRLNAVLTFLVPEIF